MNLFLQKVLDVIDHLSKTGIPEAEELYNRFLIGIAPLLPLDNVEAMYADVVEGHLVIAFNDCYRLVLTPDKRAVLERDVVSVNGFLFFDSDITNAIAEVIDRQTTETRLVKREEAIDEFFRLLSISNL